MEPLRQGPPRPRHIKKEQQELQQLGVMGPTGGGSMETLPQGPPQPRIPERHRIPERLLHTALDPPAPAPACNFFPAPPSKAITATDGPVTQRGQAGEGLQRDVDSREGGERVQGH